jgi:hypothetical protein
MLSTVDAYGSIWVEYEESRVKRGLPSAEKFLSAYVLNGKYRARTAMAWEVKSTPQHL